MKKIAAFLGIALFLVLAFFGWANRIKIRDAYNVWLQTDIPKESDFVQKPDKTEVGEESGMRGADGEDSGADEVNKEENKIAIQEINLPVPFTSQAPRGNWNLPYQEACEEASLIMAAAYARGVPSSDVGWTEAQADSEILKLVEWEENAIGYYKDTTLEETAEIGKKYFGFTNIEIRENFNAGDFRKWLAESKIIIAPFYGMDLPNPYYTGDGPLYHMLVIKGFTKDGKFITNDPGTRRGKNFLFKEKDIFNALHDWNGGDVKNGKKIVMVVGK